MNPDDLRMVLMWDAGQDTHEIARVIRLRECDVYNRLPRARAQRREARLMPAIEPPLLGHPTP